MKSIAILGSTGSVGVTTLDIVSRFPERFRVVAMAAGQNLELMAEQVRRFDPELVSVATPELARELAARLRPRRPKILSGSEGANAFANKEVLVVAGELMTRAVRDYGVRLLPVDSEHNAIFQCLQGRPLSAVKR